MNNENRDKIPLPPGAVKAVFDGASASPLIRKLTSIRAELKGNFDEEVYRLPTDADMQNQIRFYEDEASRNGWTNHQVQSSDLTKINLHQWERGSLGNKQKIAIAFIEQENPSGESEKFTALYTEKK